VIDGHVARLFGVRHLEPRDEQRSDHRVDIRRRRRAGPGAPLHVEALGVEPRRSADDLKRQEVEPVGGLQQGAHGGVGSDEAPARQKLEARAPVTGAVRFDGGDLERERRRLRVRKRGERGR
jgi:hypothetical protein